MGGELRGWQGIVEAFNFFKFLLIKKNVSLKKTLN